MGAREMLDDIANLRFDVGSVPAGSQVIVRFIVDRAIDPLYEVEYRGRRAWVHLSDLTLIGGWMDDGKNTSAVGAAAGMQL